MTISITVQAIVSVYWNYIFNSEHKLVAEFDSLIETIAVIKWKKVHSRMKFYAKNACKQIITT